ncbi:MAG: hypothetical protein SVZ03_03430 [Spirochaetota bacterium]|nr:hypothetical protein [Spirochaetota bacterium]
MKNIGIKGKRWIITLHIIFSSAWIGSAFAMIIPSIVIGLPENGDEIYALTLCVKTIDDYVIIPGAIGTLLTGLLLSMLTKWGFFIYRWVLLKWIITITIILFGTFCLGNWVNGMTSLSDCQRLEVLQNPKFIAYRSNALIFGSLQLGILLFTTVISVFKPWGRRKKQNSH